MGIAQLVLMEGEGIMLKYSEASEAVCDNYKVNLPNNCSIFYERVVSLEVHISNNSVIY